MSKSSRQVSRRILLLLAASSAITTVRREASAQAFTVNGHRVDPYQGFKFRVSWDGRDIHGVSHVSPLRRTTAVVEHRAGGEPGIVRKTPGLTRFAPITLRRGVTHDTAFEDWADAVWNLRNPGEISLRDFRKDIIIEVMNEAGVTVKAYRVFRCWPSEHEAISTLDANRNKVLMETLTLQHEGWERDKSVTEPAERSSGARKKSAGTPRSSESCR